MNTKKTLHDGNYFQLLLGLAILIFSVGNENAFWATSMFYAAIASMALILATLIAPIKLADYYSLAILAIGGIFASNQTEHGFVLTGSIVILGVVAAAASIAANATSSNADERSGSSTLDTILEAVQMTENAKRVLFRDRELSILRNTVQEDIERGEFHSALVLCDQMATVFGAVEEAEVLRTKVQSIIHEMHDARICEEVGKLEELLKSKKWVEAYQDAARLRRLFPESPQLHGLEQRIADVRTQYRHELEARFLAAAKCEDTEQAMHLLRELDGYLTPDEARRFRDTATDVIHKYRETLGARFKMAVSDRRWGEAIEFGEVIMQQFPNTKMTEEVQGMLETIRIRAGEDETAS